MPRTANLATDLLATNAMFDMAWADDEQSYFGIAEDPDFMPFDEDSISYEDLSDVADLLATFTHDV